MAHLLEKRDRWGHGVALWILVILVFLLVPACWLLTHIDLDNDIANWLPKDDPQARTLDWYLGHFQHEDRVLVSWDDSSLADPRVPRFKARLMGHPDAAGIRREGLKQVSGVVTPQDLVERMMQNDVTALEAVRRLEGVLVGTGSLKVKLTDAGRVDTNLVKRLLADRARAKLGVVIEILEPARDWEPETELVEEDPVAEDDGESLFDPLEFTLPEHDFQVRFAGLKRDSPKAAELISLATSLVGSTTPEHPEGVRLVAEDGCFFFAGSPVALSVSLSESGSADTAETLLKVRAIAEEVGIEPSSFHMGGRPVAGSALDKMVTESVWNGSEGIAAWELHRRSIIGLSWLLGLVLAFVMLKSARLATLVLAVSYYTTLMTVALVPMTGRHMNMVLVVMPTLMFVLTISGAIHVSNYWKHAAGRNMATAVVEAVRMARVPCALASFTTAIGLLSLLTSSLIPVRQFGIYSAIGCLISLVMVLYGLPALMQFWPARPPKETERHREVWTWLGRRVGRSWIAVTAVSIVLFVAGTWGLTYFRTETKAIRYFPDDSRVVQDYNFLENNLAGIIPVELIIRFSKDDQRRLNFLERMEVVREIETKVRKHPEISGCISLADFLEPYEPLPENASRFKKLTRAKKVQNIERRVKQGKTAGARSLLAVAETSTDLTTPGDARLNQAGDELWRITAQVAVMSELDYGDLTGRLDEIISTVLTAGPRAADHPGARHVVTGMVPVFLRTQQAVLDSLIWSFALAFGVIAVVMMILLKNPFAGLLTMLPNLLPVGIVFGVLSWSGQSVDIGTMITASVALGIAVDGTLHLITWFRAGLREGLERLEATARALAQCGPAMYQTSLAVGLGLLMLAPADLLLISRFGWMMAALIGAALLTNIVLLPALLAGPLGWLIQRSLKIDPADTAHQGPRRPHLKLTPAPTANSPSAE